MILHPITDFSIVQRISEKSFIGKKERFTMDSYVMSSLVDFCGDIRQNEIDKVHEVESESILHFLNVTMSLFGKYNQEVFGKLLRTNPFDMLVQEINTSYSGKEKDRIYIMAVTKMVLANGDTSLKVKAAGNMPQKMFSFRQMTADEWFQHFVDRALYRIAHVYENLGIDDATGSLCAICAYQLYHSRPSRFDISNCKDDDEALHQILEAFVKSKNGVGTRVYSESGELLSKSL